ncbi:tRNA uridine-5-carboxymethylaminomethyl(34) synthesis GTPase MnmE [Aquibium carbonis]|uniref:tRNA modification GTPase MnmE n=1 Tax=Aquibium carbonis TaxID=2495581 RepID=A0A429Z348_9HYPH|nr:tRNA uridine-5-carboxymethylaminomethyl(34) synthesis GTPase MnmE [Aquibium carbonis]RST88141.1 tRNA uridine-5-carboxymethylaminomethyl(34) synthesis GTPase MnmE [Aquibium carbonis]
MQSRPDMDTIFALSSGRLPAGLAVIRLSGPAAFEAVRAMAGDLPPPRYMARRAFRTPTGALLDRGLLVIFPGPASFTGEDCAELHLHGGKAVVAAVSRELANIPGIRIAEAGEFSQRAFTNGKFDLTTAEALADLIEAETEAQRRFAVENASGRNATLYARWRDVLIQGRALIEAELDFPEEDDVPGSVSPQVWASVEDLVREIDAHLVHQRSGEIIRDGFRVAIVGAPNAGKSSLLNALARRDVAIVSDEPGTTRDTVEVALDLEGLKVILTDTAGIRETTGTIEREGIARARAAADRADLVLLVKDGTGPAAPDAAWPAKRTLTVWSKTDLLDDTDSRETSPDAIRISTLTGDGVADLVARITAEAVKAVARTADPLPFRERHVNELTAARRALDSFIHSRDAPLELAAEQLRMASDSLARIIGVIDTEDLLDVVFSRFCIGK